MSLEIWPCPIGNFEHAEEGAILVSRQGEPSALLFSGDQEIDAHPTTRGTVLWVFEWENRTIGNSDNPAWIAVRCRTGWYVSCDVDRLYSDEEFYSRVTGYRVLIDGDATRNLFNRE